MMPFANKGLQLCIPDLYQSKLGGYKEPVQQNEQRHGKELQDQGRKGVRVHMDEATAVGRLEILFRTSQILQSAGLTILHRETCSMGRRALNNPFELAAVEPNAMTFGTPINFHSLPVRRDQIYSGTNGTFPGVPGFGFGIQLLLLDQYFY